MLAPYASPPISMARMPAPVTARAAGRATSPPAISAAMKPKTTITLPPEPAAQPRPAATAITPSTSGSPHGYRAPAGCRSSSAQARKLMPSRA